ncbi:MAG: hypothetical protein JWP25_7882 [Bradyrhizobium sp.]|jgi:hypothetical protein|nr:hypothetical protein [Bradyrhizobium sp.]
MSCRYLIIKTVAASLTAAAALIGPVNAADFPVKAVKPITDLPFFQVIDNRVSYSYIFNGTDPGVTGKTAKQTYSFTHFDAWAYGTNFFNISMFKSDHSDPATGCKGPGVGCAGATEIYGILRSTFGFNQIFNTNVFTVGPLHNVSFEVGADANTENNPFTPAKRAFVGGLQFAFDLPYKGFFNVAPMYYKEINHNAFVEGPALPSGSIDYKGTWAVETNYYMDLGFLPEYLPLSVSGRAGWYGPKGPQSSPIPFSSPGNIQTKTEFNSEPIRLTLDASRMIWGRKYSHEVDLWVAYRYWQNKFGLDHNNALACGGASAGSCTEESLYSGITVKF